MPSQQHEFPLDLIRNDPGSAVELLKEITGKSLPEFTRVRCDSAEATSTALTQLTSDSVVVCERPPYPHEKTEDPVSVLGIIVEPQNKPDPRKYYRWPAYVANTRLRLECPVVLLVLAPTSKLADRFSEPIDLGCAEVRPLVLALDTLSPVTDPGAAVARPMLTVLAMANNPTEDGAALNALLEALKSLDAASTPLYSDYVLAALEATAPGALEKLMILKDYEYKSEVMGRPFREGREKGRDEGRIEGRDEGRIEGRIEALLGFLAESEFEVSAAARERVEATTDLELLDTWLRRVVRAERIEDVFEE